MCVTTVFTVSVTWVLHPTWYTKQLGLCVLAPRIKGGSLHLDKPHRHFTYCSPTLLKKRTQLSSSSLFYIKTENTDPLSFQIPGCLCLSVPAFKGSFLENQQHVDFLLSLSVLFFVPLSHIPIAKGRLSLVWRWCEWLFLSSFQCMI